MAVFWDGVGATLHVSNRMAAKSFLTGSAFTVDPRISYSGENFTAE